MAAFSIGAAFVATALRRTIFELEMGTFRPKEPGKHSKAVKRRCLEAISVTEAEGRRGAVVAN